MYTYILIIAFSFFLARLFYVCAEKKELRMLAEDTGSLIAMHKAYIRVLWKYWSCAGKDGAPLKIILFGAGKYTLWLDRIVADLPGPIVLAVLDDNPASEFRFKGMPAIKTVSTVSDDIDMIVICSDTYGQVMKKRCYEIFRNVKIYDPYSEFPQGPFPK